MGAIRNALGIIITLLTVFWLQRPPKFDWTPNNRLKGFDKCPENTDEIHFLFGGTSLLGRYIVDTWKRDHPNVCLVNYNRRKCEKCDISIQGDIRDTRFINRALEFYSSSFVSQHLTTVILSVKPDLEFTNYKTFIEVNVNSIIEITKKAKQLGIPNFIYTSSIACSNHYTRCFLCSEETEQPLLTDYEVPYDLSKRLAEDFILAQNSDNFKTVALRVSGILGGPGDPFFHHRAFPFILTFQNPVIIDYNYAANIADALSEIFNVLSSERGPEVAGKFYYYTGEDIPEHEVAKKLNQVTGKPLLDLPYSLSTQLIRFWQWFRWNHDYYTALDLMRMADIQQTFLQTTFHETFPNFKPKYTVLQSIDEMYGSKEEKEEL